MAFEKSGCRARAAERVENFELLFTQPFSDPVHGFPDEREEAPLVPDIRDKLPGEEGFIFHGEEFHDPKNNTMTIKMVYFGGSHIWEKTIGRLAKRQSSE